MLRNFLFVLVAVLAAACGTLPPPAYEQPTLTYEAQQQVAAFAQATAGAMETLVALQPTPADGETRPATATALPSATFTSVPATATVIPPTATEVLPSATPTTASVGVDQSLADNDPLALAVENGSAAQGQTLVTNTYLTEDGAEWACSTCHNFAEDVAGLGPSMVGVGTRAFSRVPGMGPYTYLYNSIRDPQAYIVPGFETAPQAMPHFRTDSLTEPMVYDIIAYLITLK